jgi:large subunit ribosomal protein L21
MEKAGPYFMFAVIETGGKQYKVQKDDVIFVEKLAAEQDSTVEFKVLALNGDDGIKVGAPYVEGATVTGKILKNGKGKKITVFTYKPKKNEKRKMGHRQPYTKVQIEAING